MAKKKHEEEHENHERWLVSYADFITLLFAFFVILYATSQKDISKAQEFQRSVQKAFRSYVDFGGLQGKYVDTYENNQLLPPPIDVVPQEGAGPLEMKDYVEREIEKEFTESDIKELIELNTDVAGVKVSLAANSFFDSGNALIREEALPSLEKIARTIKKTGRRLIIQGHTDSLATKSDRFPSNWELSATRASTIVRYLITQHQISPRRLSVVGYADQRPVVPNDTPENRARNRRIDILIVTDEKKIGL
ncbi:MAG: OmpA family protein [Oligoflexia bacterium]|nr:OmpA family protein [Oligoflexia bacterium]